MDRKIVKPAQEGGRIWSPEHGRFLPAEGIEVEMSPYWLHLAAREDVTTSDVPVETAAEVSQELQTTSEAAPGDETTVEPPSAPTA